MEERESLEFKSEQEDIQKIETNMDVIFQY